MSAPTTEQFPTIYPDDQPQNPQAHLAEGAKQIANPDTSKVLGNFLNTTTKKIVATLGATAAIAGLGGGTVYALSGPEKPAATEADAPLINGDTNKDGFLSKSELQSMTPEAVAEVEPELLVTAYAPDFDAWRADTLTILNNKGYLLDVDPSLNYAPSGPKSAYSDRDIATQVMLDTADASLQEDDNKKPDIDAGKRMLPLVLDSESKSFQDNIDFMEEQYQDFVNTGDGITPDVNLFKPTGESYRNLGGSFNGVDLSEYADSALIKQEFVPTNGDTRQSFTEYGLYGLVKNGDDEIWQLVRRWTTEDNSFYKALTELQAAQPAK